MITQLFKRVFSKDRQFLAAQTMPKVIKKKVHNIDPGLISGAAQRTIAELNQAGHQAFIVGGAVRDLLLGLIPKDFDVATDATPEDVRQLFRRSRIVGRRFRLVHVLFGEETIEVSTFRGGQSEPTEHHHTDEHGRIITDNVFGTQAEDAVRRDFTVNALYYNPLTEEVWDYLNGVADIKTKTLRLIGDPETRFREDPVRMLRAVRLAAKLNFQIDPVTRAPIQKNVELLRSVPASRLFDEMLKLLMSGHALNSVHRLREEGLHHGVLPMLDVVLEQPLGENFVTIALQRTDERIREDRPVSPSFLFGTLLWHEVLVSWRKLQDEGMRPTPALYQAMQDVIEQQAEKVALPRRFGSHMKELWALQPRFLQRSGNRPFRLLAHPRFRAGYDFLLLRVESGEIDSELAQWWQAFIHADPEERRNLLIKDGTEKKRRRRRSKARKSTEDAGDSKPRDLETPS